MFEQEIKADPPANTQFLSQRLFLNTCATAATVAYDYNYHCDCDCDEVRLETSFRFLKLDWFSSEQPNLVDEF